MLVLFKLFYSLKLWYTSFYAYIYHLATLYAYIFDDLYHNNLDNHNDVQLSYSICMQKIKKHFQNYSCLIQYGVFITFMYYLEHGKNTVCDDILSSIDCAQLTIVDKDADDV